MRLALIILAAGILVSCASASRFDPLPIEGALRVTDGYCDLFARQTQATFNPSDSASSAKVYEVKPVAVDQRYAAEMARKLGISATPEYKSDYGVLRFHFGPEVTATMSVPAFVAEDSEASLAIEERSGIIHYTLKRRSSAIATDTPTISNDEKTDIAKRFLSGLGLLPDGDAKIAVEGSQVRWEPASFRVSENYTPLGVFVSVKGDGTVSGFVYAWQSLHSVGKYPLASETEALERLRRCDGYIISATRGAPKVGEVRLEYLGVPAEGPYRYFVPVYHFGNELALEGTPRPQNLKDPKLMTDAWVLAIADEYMEPATPEASPTELP